MPFLAQGMEKLWTKRKIQNVKCPGLALENVEVLNRQIHKT